MSRPISIVKPEERPAQRTGRVRLAVRVRQILTALESIRVKGAKEFTGAEVAAEIDRRMSASHIMAGLYSLLDKGVIECTTPHRKTYRRWRVTDWNKLYAFRTALESGAETVTNVERPDVEPWSGTPADDVPFWRRFFAPFLKSTTDRRLDRLERELESLNRKLEHLISELGG